MAYRIWRERRICFILLIGFLGCFDDGDHRIVFITSKVLCIVVGLFVSFGGLVSEVITGFCRLLTFSVRGQ